MLTDDYEILPSYDEQIDNLEYKITDLKERIDYLEDRYIARPRGKQLARMIKRKGKR
jgi:hypothetical protein